MTSQKMPLSRRGRPPKLDALSDAERQQRHREKREARLGQIALNLMRARKAGDWATVDEMARELMRF